jgi:DNA primase
VIPESFKQDLLVRVDIVDVVSRYVQLKKAGANHLGLCPFHNEKTPSFTVSAAKQFYHCFGCGVHGNAIGFLMSHSGLGYVDAIKELAASVGMQVPEWQPRTPEQAAQRDARNRPVRALGTRHGFLPRRAEEVAARNRYLKGRGRPVRSRRAFASATRRTTGRDCVRRFRSTTTRRSSNAAW